MSAAPVIETARSRESGGERISVADFVVRALRNEGVTRVFGVPGGPLLPLYEAMADCPDITAVLAKHEESAAFMAEGAAQLTGRLGVACATSGPGALHALTAAASATSDSVPLMVLTAQLALPTFGRGGLQDCSGGNWAVDTVAAFQSATKLSAMVTDAAQVPRLMRRAVRTACCGRPGAVHLSFPADLFSRTVPARQLPAAYRGTVGEPAADTVNELIRALLGADRAVILAGQGAKLARAGAELVRLAETLAIPVATTIKGKSVFPEDHPLALGVFGVGGTPAAHEYVLSDKVDLLLVVGSGLGEMASHGWDERLVRGRYVCQIDIDPLCVGASFDVDLAVVGDAAAVLRAVGERVPLTSTRRVIAGHRRDTKATVLQAGHQRLRASAVVARMSEILPDDTAVFADNGNCVSWLGQYYTARTPGVIHVSFNVASMGYSAGAAIGAKLADPTRPVVALTGDAAFAMGGMEVHTASELDLPVVWVVLNNGGNGMVHNVQLGTFGRSTSAMYSRPLDIATIARGLGATAWPVGSLGEFGSALRDALRSRGPCVVEAHVDPEEVPWALSGRIRGLKSAFERR